MKTKIKASLLVLLISMVGLSACSPKGETTSEKRTAIRQMKNETLAELVANKPEAQQQLDQAAGYAVFSNKNAKIIFAGAGAGYGIAIDNMTNKETFMKMSELSAGFGLGVSDLRAVFIFNDPAKLNTFLEKGWEFSGDADAAAKAEDVGGVSKNIELGLKQDPIVYEFTKNGIELSASIAGTKYWAYDELNY